MSKIVLIKTSVALKDRAILERAIARVIKEMGNVEQTPFFRDYYGEKQECDFGISQVGTKKPGLGIIWDSSKSEFVMKGDEMSYFVREAGRRLNQAYVVEAAIASIGERGWCYDVSSTEDGKVIITAEVFGL